MYYLIPTNEKLTRCSCGQIHYWKYGEPEHECECGRIYRKSWRNVTISMIDEHARGEDETDQLEDEWHARMMPMTDEERKRIIDKIYNNIAEIGKEYDAERSQGG